MIKKIPFKRRREGLTNYNKRLKLVKGKKPRAVVRVSNRYINCQLIKYNPKGDLTIASFNSKELSEHGFNGSNNLKSAYLTGFACGIKAKKNGVKEAVLDTGLKNNIPGSRIYAALNGLIDSGIIIQHDPKALPKEERLKKAELNTVKEKLIKVIK